MWPGYPLLPDVGNGFRARARPGVGQPVHVLQGAEDAVVGDVLAVTSRADVRPVEDGRDLVAVTAAEQRDFEDGAVLVPGDDQQAVVTPRPARVPAEIGVYPPIPVVARAGVHVMTLVRHDDRHR